VWRADLTRAGHRLAASLSLEERERAARILDPRKGCLWAASRGLLRELLGASLELEPASLRFRTGSHGKPYVATPKPSARISFSISHSGPLALLAFKRTGCVGVDVELERPRRFDELPAAKRAFGPREAARLAALAAAPRRREFLSMWVRREAAMKRLGDGPAGSRPHGERFAGAARDAARNLLGPQQRRPWVLELDLGHGAAAAVTADSAPAQMRCWEWKG
jgi:4'-phosphopantetheinyl transferase